jgi:hypothetical protein
MTKQKGLAKEDYNNPISRHYSHIKGMENVVISNNDLILLPLFGFIKSRVPIHLP